MKKKYYTNKKDYVNEEPFDFWEAYNTLNEIADIRDFAKDDSVNNSYSHFYSNIEDLLNSLKTKSIYSNKNIGIAQWDKNAGDEYSYVCMTTTKEGRTRATMNFCGPYGLSFNDLSNLSKRNNYLFDVNDENSKSKYVGEISVLNKYKVSNDEISEDEVIEDEIIQDKLLSDEISQDKNLYSKYNGSNRGYFKVFAIGKMKMSDGKTAYFISSSRDRNLKGYIAANLFYSDNGGPNDTLYENLKQWFLANINGARGYMFYQFENLKSIGFGKPTQCYRDKNGKFYPLNTINQKNTKYIPWPRYKEEIIQSAPTKEKNKDTAVQNKDRSTTTTIYEKDIDWSHTETVNINKQTFENVAVSTHIDHSSAVCFSWNIAPSEDVKEINEIIGNGPVYVVDEEGRPLFKLTTVIPTNKGGYTGPDLFLIDKDDKYSANKTKLVSVRPSVKNGKGVKAGTSSKGLLLNANQAKLFATLYDEHEYRVYIPNKQNLKFIPSDISTIVFPSTISLSGNSKRILLLKEFCNTFNSSIGITMKSFPSNLEELNRYITGVSKNKKSLTQIEINILKLIFELLGPDGPYNNVNVEFIDQPSEQSIKDNKTFYSNKVDNHARLLVNINEVVPDFSVAEKIKWHGEDSVVAPLSWTGIGEKPSTLDNIIGNKARIGSEVIVVGKDAQGKKYILFVDNAHKATNFYELPGGGLKDIPSSDKSVNSSIFTWTAQQRLQVKAGFTYDKYNDYSNNGNINKETSNTFWSNKENTNKVDEKELSITTNQSTILTKHLSNFTDTKKALIANEAVMLDDTARKNWPYSYYKLFTAEFDGVISNDLAYNHDNRQQVKTDKSLEATDWAGYVCYLEWIPIDSLDTNRHIRRRYSCLKDIISRLG